MAVTADDLILFAHVIGAGSFSQAAERVGLPKSTLSRRITHLENELGERLLTRSTRKLTITEFGERMLEHARRLLEETEAARSLALHRQVVPQGKLRVSLPSEFRELSVVTLVRRFHQDYPQVRLELDLSARRVDLIAERFDVAVRIANRLLDDSTLIAQRVASLANGLYASRDYLALHGTPTSPTDLFEHVGLALITGSGEAQAWALTNGTQHWEGMPNTLLSSNSLGLQQALAVEGAGIVGLSTRFAQGPIAANKLVAVLPEWSLPTSTVWCVTPSRRLLPERTRAFIELFKQVLNEGC